MTELTVDLGNGMSVTLTKTGMLLHAHIGQQEVSIYFTLDQSTRLFRTQKDHRKLTAQYRKLRKRHAIT